MIIYLGFADGSEVKRWHAMGGPGFDPWVGKIPWRRKWQPTAVFLPGKSLDAEIWWATVHGVTKRWT